MECDSNSKISQEVQNLGFFGAIDRFFRKNFEFSKTAKCVKFFVEFVSNGIIVPQSCFSTLIKRFFSWKSENF